MHLSVRPVRFFVICSIFFSLGKFQFPFGFNCMGLMDIYMLDTFLLKTRSWTSIHSKILYRQRFSKADPNFLTFPNHRKCISNPPSSQQPSYWPATSPPPRPSLSYHQEQQATQAFLLPSAANNTTDISARTPGGPLSAEMQTTVKGVDVSDFKSNLSSPMTTVFMCWC